FLAVFLVAAAAAPPESRLDWRAIAQRVVRQLALVPGERVVIVAHPGEFPELLRPLREEVRKAGGVDAGVWMVLPDEALAEAQPGVPASRAALVQMAHDVDAAIMMPGATPDHPEYAAFQELLRGGRGRTVHFHWRGGGAPSAIAVPGHPLPPAEEIDATYQRALLTSDCRAIGEAERRFAAAMRAGEVHVTSSAGTDLRFRIGDRPVNFQDGDASAARARESKVLIDREIELPCGAIRVAPLEETVSGTVALPPAEWADQPVEGLKLRFEHGRVVQVSAATGQKSVEAELAQGGEAARAFREFALGFNPLLQVPAELPWIPYYGYGAGVVRLSLGDNSELGGAVRGPYVRWNLFTDATVTIAGQVWVEGGKLKGL
ncbi:MAG TPA: aminopeptidase, partial [Thermoanaerobaculia bacterium]|nr:aminopeptidase [Thermoanaerobaculia bacterium]